MASVEQDLMNQSPDVDQLKVGVREGGDQEWFLGF